MLALDDVVDQLKFSPENIGYSQKADPTLLRMFQKGVLREGCCGHCRCHRVENRYVLLRNRKRRAISFLSLI